MQPLRPPVNSLNTRILSYPAIALQMSLHGTVRLRVWVTPQGTVRKVEYIGGHPLLAESAVKAVKDWKFEPASRETTELLEIKF